MSRANRAARALVIAEAKAALARLAGEGAYLAADRAPGGPGGRVRHPRAPGRHWRQPSPSATSRARPSPTACARAGSSGTSQAAACASPRPVSARWQPSRRPGAPRGEAQAQAPTGRRRARRPPIAAPLAMLRRRRHKDGRPLVSDAQFSAAEMLAADFWHGAALAAGSPPTGPRWCRRTGSAAPRPARAWRCAISVVAARQRFHRALDAVGPELAGVLVDVCCHDMGLEAAGRAWGWPQRAAKVVLDLALTRLARHYGLIAPERPAASRAAPLGRCRLQADASISGARARSSRCATAWTNIQGELDRNTWSPQCFPPAFLASSAHRSRRRSNWRTKDQDMRRVIADVHARYFGAELNDQSLTPGENPRIGSTRFERLAQAVFGDAMSPPRAAKPSLFFTPAKDPRT